MTTAVSASTVPASSAHNKHVRRSHLRRESAAVSNITPAPASALFVELAQVDKPVAAVSAHWDVELELGSGVVLRLRREAC